MLNSMQTTATLYSIQESNGPDGERYIRAFIGYEADANDPKTKGITLMSITADPVVFDTLTLPSYPATVNLTLTMLRGGQNKLKQHITSITPAAQAAKPQPAKA